MTLESASESLNKYLKSKLSGYVVCGWMKESPDGGFNSYDRIMVYIGNDVNVPTGAVPNEYFGYVVEIQWVKGNPVR
ncbi:MAG: hypothetical protein ACTSYO_08125 [Candidatus Ranarchaeia archaeon]